MSVSSTQLTNSQQNAAQLAALASGAGLTADPKAVITQIRAVQEIMKAVMKPGVHYGEIPGTDKPTLYKQGSEVLLSAFRISVEPVVTEIRDGNHNTYQVQAIGRHIATGLVVGIGIGEASTAEEKYSYRAAVCQEEFDATPEDRRRVKWNKGKRVNGQPGPAWSVNQVRTNPADLANTVLKMAKKRAQIDMTLTALAASDMFAQDLEDLPAEYIDEHTGAVEQRRPQTKNNRYQAKEKTGAPPPDGAVSDGQVRLLKAKLASNNKSDADLIAQFKVESIETLPKAKVNDAIRWIEGKGDASNG